MLRGTLSTIPDGKPGLRAKIEQIRAMVDDAVRDPEFRQMAVEQMRGVKARDWMGEVRQVVRTVQRMRFTRDPYTREGLEVFVHPKVMLLQIRGGHAYGDCDDHVLLATAMLEVIGHQTRYRVGGPRPGRYQHIWIDVNHPTKGWVPVELIRPEVGIGFDPAGLFGHTEAYPHTLGDLTMRGLGSAQMVPVPGGGPSRRVSTRVGFGTPLPSDRIRALKRIERGAGITAEQMQERSHGLGYIAAIITAVTAAAQGYDSYAKRKRAKKRQKRDRAHARATGQVIPYQEDLPDVDYSRFATQFAQSGSALYDEFTYEGDTYSNEYFREREARIEAAQLDPNDPFSVSLIADDPIDTDVYREARKRYEAGERFVPRDFDAEFAAQAAARSGQLRQVQSLRNTYQTVNQGFRGDRRGGGRNRFRDSGRRIRAGIRGIRQAGEVREGDGAGFGARRTFADFLASTDRVSARDQRAAERTLRDFQRRETLIPSGGYSLNGLAGLGEDPPPNPGPWVAKVKPLAMPNGWRAIVDEFRPVHQWDTAWLTGGGLNHPTTPKGVYDMLLESSPGLTTMTLGDAFDVNTYPNLSGHGGGPAGFTKDWGSLGGLGDPVVRWWVYLTALTSHPKLSAKAASNWYGQLKWLLKQIEIPARSNWISGDRLRRQEWEAAARLWNEYLAREEAKRLALETAEKEKRRLAAAKEEAEAAKQRAEEEEQALRAAEKAIRDAKTAEQRVAAQKRAAELRARLQRRSAGLKKAPKGSADPAVSAGPGFGVPLAVAGGGALVLWFLLRRRRK